VLDGYLIRIRVSHQIYASLTAECYFFLKPSPAPLTGAFPEAGTRPRLITRENERLFKYLLPDPRGNKGVGYIPKTRLHTLLVSDKVLGFN
jgi:hypothetical protein